VYSKHRKMLLLLLIAEDVILFFVLQYCVFFSFPKIMRYYIEDVYRNSKNEILC